MKKTTALTIVVAGLLSVVPCARILAAGGATGSGGTGTQPAVNPPGGPGTGEYQEEKSRHPRIARALRALHEAIAYMKKAPHDFGGHREDAVQASEAAIKQLRLSLEYREHQVGGVSNSAANIAGSLQTTTALASLTNSPAFQQEKGVHPRIAKAIVELNEAVAYMQKAPHDFGGHREAAVQDSQTALAQLQVALEYRETKDANHAAPRANKQ